MMIIGYDFHPQFIEAHPRLFLFTCEQESIAQHAAIIFLILPLHNHSLWYNKPVEDK